MTFEYFLTDVLVRWGFRDFILPFVLVFTIIFAILQNIEILGPSTGSGKRFHAVIAMVMGLAVVIPHVTGMYPPGKDIVEIFLQALPNVSAVIIAIVMALLILGVFGAKLTLGQGKFSGIITAAAFVIVLFIFGNAAGWWVLPDWLYWLTGSGDLQALIVTILVFAIIIYFIVHEPKNPKPESAFKELAKELLGSGITSSSGGAGEERG